MYSVFFWNLESKILIWGFESALQLRSAGIAGMAVDVCLPRRWRNSTLELPHNGVRYLSPHLRCRDLTPGHLSSSLCLTHLDIWFNGHAHCGSLTIYQI